jgi:YD repeat-containing protein
VASPDPDGVGPLAARTTEAVYDEAGTVVASRVVGDSAWTCEVYDSRGRVTSRSFPALFGEPARTVTFSYAVNGDPLTTSIADTAGTITTVVDFLGRTTFYTDALGQTTQTTYDQVGRVTGTSGPGGSRSTMYDAANGRVTAQKLNNQTLAAPSYTTQTGELASVSYPAGTGNAGNGTSGLMSYEGYTRRLVGLTWKDPGELGHHE